MVLLKEKCPKSIKNIPLSHYKGQIFALDASMAMYQFLVSIQKMKTQEFTASELRDEEGNFTGHLLGLLNRTIMLLEHGIKPVWVFDGKAPDAKLSCLSGRKEKKRKC